MNQSHTRPGNFKRLEFPTKEALLLYLESRQVICWDDYGRPIPHPPDTDDLLRFVGYSYGEQANGTWLLVF